MTASHGLDGTAPGQPEDQVPALSAATLLPLDSVLAGWAPATGGTWQATFDAIEDQHGDLLDRMTSALSVGVERPVTLGWDGTVIDGHKRLAAAHRLAVPGVLARIASPARVAEPQPDADDTRTVEVLARALFETQQSMRMRAGWEALDWQRNAWRVQAHLLLAAGGPLEQILAEARRTVWSAAVRIAKGYEAQCDRSVEAAGPNDPHREKRIGGSTAAAAIATLLSHAQDEQERRHG